MIDEEYNELINRGPSIGTGLGCTIMTAENMAFTFGPYETVEEAEAETSSFIKNDWEMAQKAANKIIIARYYDSLIQ